MGTNAEADELRRLGVQGLVDATELGRTRRRTAGQRATAPHRVLVVDSDVRVRSFLLRALIDRGYEAAASDGAWLRANAGHMGREWCVVIIDVTQGGPSRHNRSAEWAGAEGAKAPAIVTVTADPLASDLSGSGERPMLKPLFVRDWLALIDERCRWHPSR